MSLEQPAVVSSAPPATTQAVAACVNGAVSTSAGSVSIPAPTCDVSSAAVPAVITASGGGAVHVKLCGQPPSVNPPMRQIRRILAATDVRTAASVNSTAASCTAARVVTFTPTTCGAGRSIVVSARPLKSAAPSLRPVRHPTAACGGVSVAPAGASPLSPSVKITGAPTKPRAVSLLKPSVVLACAGGASRNFAASTSAAATSTTVTSPAAAVAEALSTSAVSRTATSGERQAACSTVSSASAKQPSVDVRQLDVRQLDARNDVQQCVLAGGAVSSWTPSRSPSAAAAAVTITRTRRKQDRSTTSAAKVDVADASCRTALSVTPVVAAAAVASTDDDATATGRRRKQAAPKRKRRAASGAESCVVGGNDVDTGTAASVDACVTRCYVTAHHQRAQSSSPATGTRGGGGNGGLLVTGHIVDGRCGSLRVNRRITAVSTSSSQPVDTKPSTTAKKRSLSAFGDLRELALAQPAPKRVAASVSVAAATEDGKKPVDSFIVKSEEECSSVAQQSGGDVHAFDQPTDRSLPDCDRSDTATGHDNSNNNAASASSGSGDIKPAAAADVPAAGVDGGGCTQQTPLNGSVDSPALSETTAAAAATADVARQRAAAVASRKRRRGRCCFSMIQPRRRRQRRQPVLTADQQHAASQRRRRRRPANVDGEDFSPVRAFPATASGDSTPRHSMTTRSSGSTGTCVSSSIEHKPSSESASAPAAAADTQPGRSDALDAVIDAVVESALASAERSESKLAAVVAADSVSYTPVKHSEASSFVPIRAYPSKQPVWNNSNVKSTCWTSCPTVHYSTLGVTVSGVSSTTALPTVAVTSCLNGISVTNTTIASVRRARLPTTAADTTGFSLLRRRVGGAASRGQLHSRRSAAVAGGRVSSVAGSADAPRVRVLSAADPSRCVLLGGRGGGCSSGRVPISCTLDQLSTAVRRRVAANSAYAKNYDAFNVDASWLCVFCGRRSHSSRLGDLLGPCFVDVGYPSSPSSPTGHEMASPSAAMLLSPTRKSNRRGSHGRSTEGGASVQPSAGNTVSGQSPRCAPGIRSEHTPGARETWFHQSCLGWSEHVELSAGRIEGVAAAVTHSRQQVCVVCARVGATVGCFGGGCRRVFHVPCLLESGGLLDEQQLRSFCRLHRATLGGATCDPPSGGSLLPCANLL